MYRREEGESSRGCHSHGKQLPLADTVLGNCDCMQGQKPVPGSPRVAGFHLQGRSRTGRSRKMERTLVVVQSRGSLQKRVAIPGGDENALRLVMAVAVVKQLWVLSPRLVSCGPCAL